MEGFLDPRTLQLIFWMALLTALLVGGGYVVGKIRPKAIQQELRAAPMLAKFREMHSRGVLSDAEFRTIKTTLATQLKDEPKDHGETG
jgi:uncharacterized membrane protein